MNEGYLFNDTLKKDNDDDVAHLDNAAGTAGGNLHGDICVRAVGATSGTDAGSSRQGPVASGQLCLYVIQTAA